MHYTVSVVVYKHDGNDVRAVCTDEITCIKTSREDADELAAAIVDKAHDVVFNYAMPSGDCGECETCTEEARQREANRTKTTKEA